MSSKNTVRALIVGINDFLHQKNLSGCVNDANKVADYLTNAVKGSFDLSLKKLEDDEATREKLIAAIKTQLIDPAEENDTIFFYFSGHGGQEMVHAAFERYEADNKLEGLVCQDSGVKGECLLADKEIRYLMSPLKDKNCHIVMIFDCCHAGDITRDNEETDLLERRISSLSEPRPWDQFVFSSDPQFSSPDKFKDTHINDLLPAVNHIQMAACQDFESAYEHPIKKFGYFTKYLLETLDETGGQISYYELQRRIRNIMRIKHRKQTPCMHTPRDHHEEIFKTFLSDTIAEKPVLGNITYHKLRRTWTMDLGGIHGVNVEGENANGEESAPSIVAETGQNEKGEPIVCDARIVKVHASYSEIAFEPHSVVDKNQTYKGYISGLLLDDAKVFLKGDEDGVLAFANYAKTHDAELKDTNRLTLVNTEEDANYIVEAEGDAYYLYSSWQKDMPLIEEIWGYNEDGIKNILGKLAHISRWSFVKKLSNPTSTIRPLEPIEVTVISSSRGEVRYDSSKGSMILNPKEAGSGRDIQYQFLLKNNAPHQLYISCLYLNRLFAVEVDYLEPKVVPLSPGLTIYALNAAAITLEVAPHIQEFNLPEEEVYLKIIASTEPFDVDMFALPELKAPVKRNAKGFSRAIATMGSPEGWQTQLLTFRIPNLAYMA